MLISLMDITERKRMEDALRELDATLEQRVADRTAEIQAANVSLAAANVRLTELDRLKDEFLSRISHELRTPLSGLMISLELLVISKPNKRERYLQRLKEAAERLQTLIEDVLTFSQLNHQLEAVRLDRLTVNDWIEGRLSTWQKQCTEHGLALQLDLSPTLPAARADAVSYTPAGSVTLSTEPCESDGQNWVTIHVTDTGPGITPTDLPHIFERFYRGHRPCHLP